MDITTFQGIELESSCQILSAIAVQRNGGLSKKHGTPKYRSRGEIPKILELAWGKAFVEVVALWRLACV